MNDIDLLLIDIKEEILNESCVKEYLRLKNIIKNDKHLLDLEKSIRNHQRKMCEYRKDPIKFDEEKILYEKCTKEFELNPIVKNFNICKEETYNFLYEIKGVLEKWL